MTPEEAPQTGEATTNQTGASACRGPAVAPARGPEYEAVSGQSLDDGKHAAREYPRAKITHGRGGYLLNCRDNSCETPALLRAYLMKP